MLAERLGDEKARLDTLVVQEPLGKGGDEDHRDRPAARPLGQPAVDDVVDSLDARAGVGELDVGENQARARGTGHGDRLVPRGGDAEHPVPRLADDAGDVHGDHGLVLDDQDVGLGLLVEHGLRRPQPLPGFLERQPP